MGADTLMVCFKSHIKTKDPVFQTRFKSMKSKVSHLNSCLEEVFKKGSEKGHPSLKKYNKNPVRLRIQKLIDKNSHFLELSPLAGWKMYDFEAPSGGLVTGTGLICGRECMIIANDPTVKGGSYLPISVKKQLRAQEVAFENRLPCIYLVDSGGAYLPLQSEIFPDSMHFGKFFYNQSQMSALGLEQISLVFGRSTAGGAYIPALSDETLMVRGQSAVFLGGPSLVFSATGEKISAEDLGGALLHCEKSGVSDHLVETEEEAFDKARSILSIRGSENNKFHLPQQNSKEPLYDPQEIYGILPEDLKEPFDVREILARILDSSEWEEFKEHFGKTLFTARAYLCGWPVGILANQGVLMGESALKATHFIDLCDRQKIPLIFFQNITGFMVGQKYESEGIAKHGAKMVSAVSLARVPKFTVLIGASYGAGNYGMCGRAYKPRGLWTWPSSKIGVMGAQMACHVLSDIGKKSLNENEKKNLIEKYEKESSPYYSTARLWDDGLIDPVETRRTLALGIKISLNAPLEERKKAIYRM